MSTRRENAIKKIKRLTKELETFVWTKKGVESHTREIMRLQVLYKITDNDIRTKGKYVVVKGKAVWKPGKWRI